MIIEIMQVIQAFLVKIMDNSLNTCKSIFQNKEFFFISAIFATASQYFYIVGVKQIVTGSNLMLIAMLVATFIGTYCPGKLLKKIERERPWTFDITASSFDEGIEFADKLRALDLDIKTTVSYDNEITKVISCKVKCRTKEHSRLVMKHLPENFEWEVTVPLQIQL